MEEQIRLQKYMALCGVASRRTAEQMIADGRVKLNGKQVSEQGIKVNPKRDRVFVDAREIKPEKKKYYIMLNKPTGYITTSDDQFDRKTVLDLVGDIDARLYPVGRLDYDSEGLLLLTNDGDFAYEITHPKHKIAKTYHVTINGHLSNDDLWKLRKGIMLEEKMTMPAKVEIIKLMDRSSVISITISEGRNRQVRKMCEAVSHEVTKLRRVSVGGINLGNLPMGKWRHLSESEIKEVLKND